jgi:hypothetical protein
LEVARRSHASENNFYLRSVPGGIDRSKQSTIDLGLFHLYVLLQIFF